MIDLRPEIPKEILTMVFRYLYPEDLVSCSRTCWAWNDTANAPLYETVTLSTCSKYYGFIQTVTNFEYHLGSFFENAINRHQQLGHLVKVVEITADYSWNGDDEVHNYSTNLSQLISRTPNVHTSKLFLPVSYTNTEGDPIFDWTAVASQWTKLTSLTLKKPLGYTLASCDLNNINGVLNRLQNLDITPCGNILCYMPTLLPMPSLKALMANIFDTSDYQALKKILQGCQGNLHTLIIAFHYTFLRPLSVDLDDLKIGHNQLKAFGMTTHDDSQIRITNFGDHLEHLEWRSSGIVNDTANQSIWQAMIKTCNLKSLSLLGHMSLDNIRLVLGANKSTLHTFYWDHMAVSGLISPLLTNHIRLYNVTTLCLDRVVFENSDVRSLAEIFPNVEFLALRRCKLQHEGPWLTWSGSMQNRRRVQRDVKWIATETLSHFRHLKAIDEITFLELIDQGLFTYEKCNIFPSQFTKQPHVMPLSL
jgi:hypothetical protein